MGVLRLDFLMNYLSDAVVKGFTTAAAFFVLASQLSKIFAVRAYKHIGLLQLFHVSHFR